MSKNREEKLISSSKSGNLLTTIYNLQKKENRDRLSGHLIKLHNLGKIDVITEFIRLKKTDNSYDFFVLYRVLESVLPKISAPVIQVMECVKQIIFEAGDDMAAYRLINNTFIEFLATEKGRVEEALHAALNKTDEEFAFIVPAILAGTKLDLKKYVEKAIELSQHTNSKVRTKAVYVLGEMRYFKDKALTMQAMTAIEVVASDEFNEPLFASVLRSSYSLYNQDSNLEEKVTEIFKVILLKYRDDLILHTASEILWLKRDIPKLILQSLLGALVHTKTKDVIFFLEKILLKNPNISITQFDSVNREILSNQKVLNQIITKWLLSKKIKLGKSIADLLLSSSQKPYYLSVDKEQLIASEEDICLFLAKKACGWFFMRPVSATSFIMSLIDEAPKNEQKEIAEILFNPLLIIYSKNVKKYLESVLPNASKTQNSIINSIFEKLKKYHEGLNKARNIKEFIPPVAHREAYHRYHTILMEESKKNSIFSGLITEQVILYSNRTINYFKPSPESEPTRQEMKLQSHNLSFEFPSVEHLDHNGLQCILYVFKTEGCT